jgi:flavin-dependent dehydrogenase
MENKNEVVIIGGGLAGLIAGIHLSRNGINVSLLEKNDFPKHKVCGEYISNEVLSYFNYLELQVADLKPTQITKLKFSTADGTSINAKLPLGGFGISRYSLDLYLYHKAIENGCKIIKDSVEEVTFNNDKFLVTTANGLHFQADFVLGAFGKKSALDVKLNRDFVKQKSPWLAVKAHFSGEFPNDLVGLHNFKGGYCGVSKVENERINVCYLAAYKEFKEYKSVNDFQNLVLKQNPHLQELFQNCKLLFEKPLTISQISFEKKNTIDQHILMIGDSAGLIHPLCGNGMAMAIHSAKIVSELLVDFYDNSIKSRQEVEEKYQKIWNHNFKKRLKTGQLLSKLFLKPRLSRVLIRLLIIFPFILTGIIKKTHGKPI